MLDGIKRETIRILFNVNVRGPEDTQAAEAERAAAQARSMQFQHASSDALASDEPAAQASSQRAGRERQPFVREQRKVGRNEPCPCGSGKKFKACHGRLDGGG